MKKYYHLFRIKHYFKNLIIFTPILFIEKKIDFLVISNLLNIFLIFCLTASLVYIYNDIADIKWALKEINQTLEKIKNNSNIYHDH